MIGLLFCASAYAGLLAHLAFRAADDYERAATYELMDRGDRNRAMLRATLLHWLALALTTAGVVAGVVTVGLVCLGEM